MMKSVIVLIALVAMCFAGASKADDIPVIVRGSKPGTDVVHYQATSAAPLEAWEIVLNWVDGTYLNYSRAAWGDTMINGQPTVVCFAKADGQKFVGISENSTRLLVALQVVLMDQKIGAFQNLMMGCHSYAEILKTNPANADLKTYVNSL